MLAITRICCTLRVHVDILRINKETGSRLESVLKVLKSVHVRTIVMRYEMVYSVVSLKFLPFLCLNGILFSLTGKVYSLNFWLNKESWRIFRHILKNMYMKTEPHMKVKFSCPSTTSPSCHSTDKFKSEGNSSTTMIKQWKVMNYFKISPPDLI